MDGDYHEQVQRLKDNPATRRPFIMFRILLVLSIIGSGANCFSYLLMGMIQPILQQQYPAIEETMQSSPQMAEMFELTKAQYEQFVFDTPRAYYLMAFVLFAISLTGVVMMWRLRKNGFHYYAVAQLLFIILTLLYLGKASMSVGNIMFILLFLFLYYSLLRVLELNGKKREDPPKAQ